MKRKHAFRVYDRDMLTTDDVVEALCTVPGDLVLFKENFQPSSLYGVGLVVSTELETGVANVMWTKQGMEPRIRRHSHFELIKLKPGSAAFVGTGPGHELAGRF